MIKKNCRSSITFSYFTWNRYHDYVHHRMIHKLFENNLSRNDLSRNIIFKLDVLWYNEEEYDSFIHFWLFFQVVSRNRWLNYRIIKFWEYLFRLFYHRLTLWNRHYRLYRILDSILKNSKTIESYIFRYNWKWSWSSAYGDRAFLKMMKKSFSFENFGVDDIVWYFESWF